jgi:uroporphyrin-III C-methyltransferase/precorrin-2 dehydrogenase/sirohydrochlorin ferrochelatase
MPEITPKPIERVPEKVAPQRMAPLATLPVFFKLAGKRVLVAGGSEPALWKAELLSAAGAHVDVYGDTFVEPFERLAAKPPAGRITLHFRSWRPQDLAGATIAIGALSGAVEAAAFKQAASDAGVPVNVVDRPDYCAFQFGAIVNRSPLVVGISTGGGAPVFAQGVRSRLEALLPQGFKRWAQAAKSWRGEGERLGADIAARRRFWENFTQRAFANPDKEPDVADLEDLIAQTQQSLPSADGTGFVSLVGAGPGDPELLTLRAVRALRSADVVLYDDLVSDAVLDFARREAERILVGKKGHGPACKQTEINALMVSLAHAGKRVVRLKSGEPMIFGRGGEEIAELNGAHIPFEIVPGISAVQAAAARLKVSLTHRDHAKRLQFVTGHARDGHLPQALDWTALSDPHATTAVYMAHRTLTELSQRLIAQGLPATTPAFALLNVSREDERIIASTMRDLPGALSSSGAHGPCLVIYGEALRDAATGGVPIATRVSPATA